MERACKALSLTQSKWDENVAAQLPNNDRPEWRCEQMNGKKNGNKNNYKNVK